MRTEKDVKARVKKALDVYNYFWFSPPANGYGKAGISDILAIKDGVFMAVETKFGSNKPTALQRAFLDSIRAEHGYGFVVHDKNIEWFEAFLAAFDRSAQAIGRKEQPSPEDGATMLNAIRELTALI